MAAKHHHKVVVDTPVGPFVLEAEERGDYLRPPALLRLGVGAGMIAFSNLGEVSGLRDALTEALDQYEAIHEAIRNKTKMPVPFTPRLDDPAAAAAAPDDDVPF